MQRLMDNQKMHCSYLAALVLFLSSLGTVAVCERFRLSHRLLL